MKICLLLGSRVTLYIGRSSEPARLKAGPSTWTVRGLNCCSRTTAGYAARIQSQTKTLNYHSISTHVHQRTRTSPWRHTTLPDSNSHGRSPTDSAAGHAFGTKNFQTTLSAATACFSTAASFEGWPAGKPCIRSCEPRACSIENLSCSRVLSNVAS